MAKSKEESQAMKDIVKDAVRTGDMQTLRIINIVAPELLPKSKGKKNRLSNGGMPTKNYVNPITIKDNRKNK